jgi:hypothetical protein
MTTVQELEAEPAAFLAGSGPDEGTRNFGAYFGTTFGSPPGVPGGGMTGIVLLDEVGGLTSILGSTFFGGGMTPPDLSRRSLRLPEFGGADDEPWPATFESAGDPGPAASATDPAVVPARHATIKVPRRIQSVM